MQTKEVAAIGNKVDSIRVNERIRVKTVRLISGDGRQLGIVPIREAIETATEEGMDLVEVAPNSDPPVCRIMDYGKYKYETSKKVQEARKKGKTFQIKEIKMRPHTDAHDLGFKIRNLKRFLEKKNRVKLTVIFRGREFAHKDAGLEILKKVAEEVMDIGTVEQPPKHEGRNMSVIIVPK